ncbi:hypothetical protein SLS58_008128 [Diplodia intermedia]|uniref:Uncharacterized protein n=1 Tax=Diplodia intermedia TaxID=856260 RepID=A0ABR3TID6_9PEZI
MPPIPIFSDAPINPQTAAKPDGPQPGAAPVPAPTGTTTSSASPGTAVTKTVTETVTMQGGPPPQFGIPAPGANAAATHSTDHRGGGAAANGATTINFGMADGGGGATRTRGSSTASLEHPPGYVQNQYPDGTAAQRAALEAAAARDREEGGVWGTVKGLAATVGEGLKKADQEAWKLVGQGK